MNPSPVGAPLGEAVPAQAALGNVTVSPGPAPVSRAPCPTCGSFGQQMILPQSTVSSSFVYAFGWIEPRFPNIGVEKEFAQFASRAPRSGIDDSSFIRAVLADPDASYLARHFCWVFVNQAQDCFVIVPRDQHELLVLIQGFVSSTDNSVIVVVGRSMVGAQWAPDTGEPALPRFSADQLIRFETDEFVGRVPRSDDLPEEQFRSSIRNIFSRILRRSNNTGLSDDHRALNYIALRYPAIFEVSTRAAAKSLVLASIDARPQIFSDGRRTVTIRFNYRGPGNGFTERYSCRVDVTEEFPFILSPLQQTFDE